MSALERLPGSTPCRCGACRRVATERIEISDDLGAALVRVLAGRPAIPIGDPRTLAACRASLVALPGAAMRDLESDGSALHADDAAVERTVGLLGHADPRAVPVAVGSGTVNDVVKAASHRLGRPYVAVATAASMNGYTSAIAAITVAGLKSTLPSTPPRAVVASPRVLARAPGRLALSGLADLLSKPVSAADWRLSHLLWGDPYCPTPVELSTSAVRRAVDAAAGIAGGDPVAVVALFEALLVSGISMAVAGTSSPASGGEHLVSHWLDMTAAFGAVPRTRAALHGEQVGVATRATTRLYRALLERGAGDIDWKAARAAAPDEGRMRAALAAAPGIPDDLRERFAREGGAKLRRLGGPGSRVDRIREAWPALRRALRQEIAQATRYATVLPATGAATSASDLGVPGAEFRVAFRLARWVRDRYTVLDLADDVGLLAALEDEALAGIV